MILTHGANSIGGGDFIFLCNFTNYEYDSNTGIGIIHPELGDDYIGTYNIGILDNSPKFSSNSLFINNYTQTPNSSYSSPPMNIHKYKILTYEMCLSGLTSNVYAAWFELYLPNIRFAFDGNGRKQLVELNAVSNITLYNGASYWTSTETLKRVWCASGTNYMHYAATIDVINGTIHFFGNGTLYIVATISADTKMNYNKFANYENKYDKYLDYVSVRKGDFSNNLQSFTVPTEKYHL
jgi:hypothetical protein